MLVRKKTGAGETATNVTSIRLADAGDTDMAIPGVPDQNYSEQVILRLYQESESVVANPKCYGAGSMPSGINVWVKAQNSYSEPITPTDVSDMALLSSYSQGSPLDLDTTDSYLTNNADIGKYVVLVAELDRGTSVGLKVGQDIIFEWERA